MTSKKRGLGRGLEVLLADVPVKADNRNVEGKGQDLRMAVHELMEHSLSAEKADTAIALNNNLHRERLNLLEEAEILKKLIEGLESAIQGDS